VTGAIDDVVVVVQFGAPAAPTQRVTVTVEGGVVASSPAGVRKFTTAMVQATSSPPTFISPLHSATACAACAGCGCWPRRPTPIAINATANITAVTLKWWCGSNELYK
jgi:hypothetical protein